MPTTFRLTPTQIAVLRAVDAGDVCRSESVGTLYKSFRDSDHRNVTRVVNRLADLHLIELGEQLRFRRKWKTTDAGKALLAEAREAVARRRNPTA